MQCYKTFYARDFIDNGDGTHSVTILASTHGMGLDYNCVRILKHKSGSEFSNVVASYKIAANGDFTLTVNEPATYRVGLEQTTNPQQTNSLNADDWLTADDWEETTE